MPEAPVPADSTAIAAPVVDMKTATQATITKRLVAGLIDGTLRACLLMPLLNYTGILEKLQKRPLGITWVDLFCMFMASQAIHLLLNAHLLSQHGQTIGKRFMRLRVVEATGHACTLSHLFFVRWMVPQVVMKVPFVGVGFLVADLAFIFRADRRCLHDHIASTVVIDA
jgi:uncharacterized RDD family membrane protein YckC